MRAVVFTLGCKVNEVESASIMAALDKLGYDTGDTLGYADIYVLNTCAVTREAERKSRQLISRARRFNPSAEIYVCGCASQKDAASYVSKGATFVCGARDKGRIVGEIAAKTGRACGALPYPKQTKTRAFIKIQDGCNNFCSYCIIPYLRGREISRTISDIIDEIAQTDAPEIVLNGINVSSYSDGDKGLSELISALSDTHKRIRLGSLECGVIDEKLLKALKALPDFAEQFHLSLQSGSNAVLKAMNRHYTRETYIEKCDLIYKYFPDAAITTDIIAGFAGETDEDFKESLKIIDEVGFARVHAFAFSPRERTAAFKMKDTPPDIKSARLHALLDAGAAAERRFIEKRIGKTYVYIPEESENGFTTGYTGNYIKIYEKGAAANGKKRAVTVTELYKDGAIGK